MFMGVSPPSGRIGLCRDTTRALWRKGYTLISPPLSGGEDTSILVIKLSGYLLDAINPGGLRGHSPLSLCFKGGIM